MLFHVRMDVRILSWGSVAVLLRRPIAVHRESGQMNPRQRWAQCPEP